MTHLHIASFANANRPVNCLSRQRHVPQCVSSNLTSGIGVQQNFRAVEHLRQLLLSSFQVYSQFGENASLACKNDSLLFQLANED